MIASYNKKVMYYFQVYDICTFTEMLENALIAVQTGLLQLCVSAN